MKNILFIEPFVPYPLKSGGHQAIYNGIAALEGVANVYIVYSHTSWIDHEKVNREEMEKQLPFVHFFHFPLTEKSAGQFVFKLKRRITRFFGKWHDRIFGVKEQVEWLRSWGFEPQPDHYAAYINQLIKDYHIDVVQVEMCWQLSMVLDLPKDVRKVFVHHELRYVREELRLRNLQVPESFRHEVIIHKFEEIGLLNMYDDIVVLSETDKAKLQEAGVVKPIHTSFAVVNTDTMHELIAGADGYTLTFVGPESHDPNKDGVEWFLDNCWDKLLSADSNYKLRIIGAWSNLTQQRMCQKYKNLEFAGFVPKLVDALLGTVMIVPIRVGSGIRMKILEAGAIGVPVVSTCVGAEGIPLVNGESAYLTDDANQFVDDILKLRDKEIRTLFIHNLHELVQENYSYKAFVENRKGLYI